MSLRAPFPWFGGKRRVAHIVWRALGNVPNYVEPFYGSGAVLLERPHESKIETVNDIDCMLANFWRAVTAVPDEVARWCDWPVNEADLHARHRWLVEHALTSDFRQRLRHEPEYFDAKVAGWWVWGISMWIGSGWCQLPRDGQTSRSARGVVHEKRPELYGRNGGRGVHRPSLGKRPNVGSNTGEGVHRLELTQKTPRLSSNVTGRARPRHRGTVAWNARPDLGGNGQGVHATDGHIKQQIPSLHGRGRGITAPDESLDESMVPCREWFRALQDRLRRVRVCCGDWKRVLTDSVVGTTRTRNSGMNPCGIFLDPPYSDDERARDLYGVDDGAISKQVAEWAREHGGDRDLRIALCGYDEEHEMPPEWTCYAWKATRGYAAEDNDNRARERIWFSPGCLPIEDAQGSLFTESA